MDLRIMDFGNYQKKQRNKKQEKSDPGAADSTCETRTFVM